MRTRIYQKTFTVTGPLSWLWVKLVARNVANSVPDETEMLVIRARELHD